MKTGHALLNELREYAFLPPVRQPSRIAGEHIELYHQNKIVKEPFSLTFCTGLELTALQPLTLVKCGIEIRFVEATVDWPEPQGTKGGLIFFLD